MLKGLLYQFYERRLLADVLLRPTPRHLGLIQDGHRRYAREAGLSNSRGYALGAIKTEEVLTWCAELRIPMVTLWWLSTENLGRHPEEVNAVLEVIEEKMTEWVQGGLTERLGIRVRPVGKLELLPASAVQVLQRAEAATRHRDRRRQEILDAVRGYLRDSFTRHDPPEDVLQGLTPEAVGKYLYLYIRKWGFWLDVRLIPVSFWITFRGKWEHRGKKLRSTSSGIFPGPLGSSLIKDAGHRREDPEMLRPNTKSTARRPIFETFGALVALCVATLTPLAASAEQPPPPCHPNPQAASDMATVASRGDVALLPAPLKDRLVQLAGRPHTYLPMQVNAEAPNPSQLFQYYLLDTHGFEPNVFTTRIPGVNDAAMLTVTGANCGLPTVAAVRVALEPKPGLPTDPNDVRAFIDIFTDISGLFVINNESGWYEGWMIHDLVVPPVAPPRPDGHAQFGTITAADAAALAAMGSHHNVPGQVFTVDGNAERFPSESDHFPDVQTNVVPIHLSMGAYNCLQQADCHAYWEFNYTTNWVHPLYELPFTGGFPDKIGAPPDALQDGEIGALQSIVPGPGPAGKPNKPQVYGDNPNRPRDPDLFDADIEAQREFRQRFIPSGLANEILLDVYARPVSFEPRTRNLTHRLFKAYAAEVARVDQNGDGVISASEGDIDTATDGFPDNSRLFLPATVYKRFAVTREINDGLLAPRFAPSQRGWVLQGSLVPQSPPVPASAGRDADDR